MNTESYREKLIKSGRIAVDELLKVIEEPIITGKKEEDLSPDRLKNAAATKKLAMFDAFDILARIDQEEEKIAESKGEKREAKEEEKPIKLSGFAERNAKKGKSNGGGF
jgi:hypothetical protein